MTAHLTVELRQWPVSYDHFNDLTHPATSSAGVPWGLYSAPLVERDAGDTSEGRIVHVLLVSHK